MSSCFKNVEKFQARMDAMDKMIVFFDRRRSINCEIARLARENEVGWSDLIDKYTAGDCEYPELMTLAMLDYDAKNKVGLSRARKATEKELGRRLSYLKSICGGW